MESLFSENFVYSESCMFAGERKSHLLYDAAEILKVTIPATGKKYVAGVDFIHDKNTNVIRLTEESEIPFVSCSELHPDGGEMAIPDAVDGGYLLFDNCDYFAKHQVQVNYRICGNKTSLIADPQKNRLPRTRRMLAERRGLKVSLHGDSISQGYNASKFTNTYPYQARYIELFCNTLPVKVDLCDHALSGMGIKYPREIREEWINDNPDLMVIAFGMNDFNKMTAAEFISELDWLIKENSAVYPDTEYIVVTPMTGNPEWRPTLPGPDLEFACAMREYVASSPCNVALADVQSIWRKILERKSFYDLTGNGVNHPNDYGHRIYASVITGVLSGISCQ